MITVSTDLTALNRDLALYSQLARKSIQETIIKKGASIAIGGRNVEGWFQRLRPLAPAKGEVTRSRLAALASGGGIKVRKSAYAKAAKRVGSFAGQMGKKGTYTDLVTRNIMRKTRKGMKDLGGAWQENLQAQAVKSELAMRERARGFSAFGASMSGRGGQGLVGMVRSFPTGQESASATRRFRGNVEQDLSQADIRVSNRGATAGMVLSWGTGQTVLGEALSQPAQQRALGAAIRDVHADMMLYIRRKLDESGRKARLK